MFGWPSIGILDLQDQSSWEGERKSAERLEDLESPSGLPYREIEADGRNLFMGSYEPRYARTDYDPIAAATGSEPRFFKEFAYYCDEQRMWIQGAPRGERYDNISFLSGSAGTKLCCRECDREIGRLVEVVS